MDSRSKPDEPAKTETVQKKHPYPLLSGCTMNLFGTIEYTGLMYTRDNFDYSATPKTKKTVEETWVLNEETPEFKK